MTPQSNGVTVFSVDRITRSLLEEFTNSAELNGEDESTQFEHLSAHATLSSHLSETFDTRDVVVGGGEDTGIDAIAIIVNGVLVTDPEMVEQLSQTNGSVDASFIFIQSETTSGFSASKLGNFGFGVEDFFSETPRMGRGKEVSERAEIMEAVYAKGNLFTRGNPTCRLYYITTGQWKDDRNLVARQSSITAALEALNLFRDVVVTPIDASSLQKLYNSSKNAVSCEFTFPNKATLPDMDGVSEAYLGFLPAREFLKIVDDKNGGVLKTIFYDNVRDWQDYNSVNEEIKETLESPAARQRFVLMNNGVTIIAKVLRPTGPRVYIEDYQIVNGCQTTHVLADNRETLDETVVIPLRLIASKDEDVIRSIVKATNRQTEVKAEQLIALSDFQKKLELYFSSFTAGKRLFYERRSRQYAASTSGLEKTRIVTPSNLIRAYASVIQGEPHRTTRSYRTLLKSLGKDIFGPEHKLEPYYASASALYRLDYMYRNGILDSKFRPARYHILYAFRLLANVGEPPKPTARKMAKYSDSLVNIIWDMSVSDDLFKKSADLVDQAAKGNFHRDQIRTQPFTEAVRSKCEEALEA